MAIGYDKNGNIIEIYGIDGSGGGGGGSEYILPTASTTRLGGVKVDGETTQMVDGVLKVNLDELGNEVNALANTVNTINQNYISLQSIIPYVEGQWVNNNLLLTDYTNIPTTDYTYDLSNYLPNDDYNYEILLYGIVNASKTANAYIHLMVNTDIITGDVSVASIRCVNASYSQGASSSIIIPVGTARTLVVKGRPSDNGTYKITIAGYKRLAKPIPTV